MVRYCSNETGGAPEIAALGYWSPTDVQGFPHAAKQWLLPLVMPWIVGKPVQVINNDYDPNDPTFPTDNVLLFKEAPSLQAAHCEPVIEVIQAMVTVDRDTASILLYEPSGAPKDADAA
jgi:hypothetical protein